MSKTPKPKPPWNKLNKPSDRLKTKELSPTVQVSKSYKKGTGTRKR